MKTKMKRFVIIIFLAVLVIFVLNNFSLAAEEETGGRLLEVEYIKFLGFKIGETTATPLPYYIKYIFYAIIAISGITALGALVWAGYRYLTSTGIPEKMKDAQNQITAAFLGLIILLGSVLIIQTINPKLATIKIEPVLLMAGELRPGIMLCDKPMDILAIWRDSQTFKKLPTPKTNKEREIYENLAKKISEGLERVVEHCRTVDQAQKNMGSQAGSIMVIYAIPEEVDSGGIEYDGKRYIEHGAIVEDTSGDTRRIRIYDRTSMEQKGRKLPPGQPAPVLRIQPKAILPFRINYTPNPTWKATVFEKENYNKDYFDSKSESCKLKNWHQECGELSFPAQSIKLEGEIIALLSKSPESRNFVILLGNESNLLQYDWLNDYVRCWIFLKCKVPVGKYLELMSVIFY